MRRHYFVDYEVYSGGQPTLYGQFALTWGPVAEGRFCPDDLLTHVRQRAADRHRVALHDVRVKTLSRL